MVVNIGPTMMYTCNHLYAHGCVAPVPSLHACASHACVVEAVGDLYHICICMQKVMLLYLSIHVCMYIYNHVLYACTSIIMYCMHSCIQYTILMMKLGNSMVSLGALVPNSRDRHEKQWRPDFTHHKTP